MGAAKRCRDGRLIPDAHTQAGHESSVFDQSLILGDVIDRAAVPRRRRRGGVGDPVQRVNRGAGRSISLSIRARATLRAVLPEHDLVTAAGGNLTTKVEHHGAAGHQCLQRRQTAQAWIGLPNTAERAMRKEQDR